MNELRQGKKQLLLTLNQHLLPSMRTLFLKPDTSCSIQVGNLEFLQASVLFLVH